MHILHLEALYNLGRAVQTESDLSQPTVKDWVNAVINALKWGKQNNKLVTIHALIHFFNPNLCNFCGPMCGNTLVINHQGMLTACSEVVDDGNKDWATFFLGEFNQSPKINKEKLTYLADRTTANMIVCKSCFAKYICRGGCAYRGFTASGEIYSPDPRHCEFVKTILPIIIKRMTIGEY